MLCTVCEVPLIAVVWPSYVLCLRGDMKARHPDLKIYTTLASFIEFSD